MSAAPHGLQRRVLLFSGALLVIVGLVLRIYAALGDFWLDEIWSLAIAQQARSLLDLFHYKVDNNHLLNTMLMRLIGEHAYWPIYRVPSIIAGGVSIILAGVIARRWSPLASLAAMMLFALSYPMVLYGSEARGYSLAVMFTLAAIALQMRWMMSASVDERAAATVSRPSPQPSPSGRWATIGVFWFACALGMMSHPLFVQPYLGLLAWAIWETIRHQSNASSFRLVASHLPPLLFVAVMYAVHWRGMEVAGGAIVSPWRLIASAAALVIGCPRDVPAFTIVGAVVACALVSMSIIAMLRRRDSFSVFAVLAIAIVPAAFLVALRPAVLYERYFLLPLAVALVTLARALAGVDSHRTRRPAVCFAALIPILLCNVWQAIPLLTVGRGQYLAALEHIAAQTSGSEIVIGSDHDFRNRIVIEFYARYLDKPVRYVSQKQWPSPDGQWFIVHGLGHDDAPREMVTDQSGLRWQLEAHYECADLSGWRWFVYRRASP